MTAALVAKRRRINASRWPHPCGCTREVHEWCDGEYTIWECAECLATWVILDGDWERWWRKTYDSSLLQPGGYKLDVPDFEEEPERGAEP